MPVDLDTIFTRQLVVPISLFGMRLDLLGGIDLAYDLLGGKNGPLRTITRAVVASRFSSSAILSFSGPVMRRSRPSGWGFCSRSNTGSRAKEDRITVSRAGIMLFWFLRGVVFGLAAITVAGPKFGLWFEVLSGQL